MHKLEINKLLLPMHIGVSSEERSYFQDIELNIKIDFLSLPTACISNNLSDTICYDNLVKEIKNFCKEKEFSLIEKLCYEVYQHLKQHLPECKLTLQVCKNPPIEEIKGNCCFTICSSTEA